MDKRYLIFVSSTFSDLKEERRKVMEQILNMGHFPVGMELFQASNDDQWSYIERRIRDCDYYLLIVGERYGSVADDNLSYTEKEFDLALASGVPISAHLISNDARRFVAQEHVQFDKKDEVEAFRKKAERGRIVKYWKDSNELALNVANALHEQFRDEPRVGLVKGSQMLTVQVTNEIARLSSDNELLRAEVQATSSNSDREIEALLEKFSQSNLADYFEAEYREYTDTSKTLNDLIFAFAREFGIRASKNYFEQFVDTFTVLRAKVPNSFTRSGVFGEEHHPFAGSIYKSVTTIVNTLLLVGLLKIDLANLKEGGVRTDYERTDMGKKYLSVSAGVAGVVDLGAKGNGGTKATVAID